MKTQLKIRTEYSFRTAYGPIEQVIDHLKRNGCQIAAITDRSSTFGHVNFNKLCKLHSIKPIFGVELAFTPDVNVREKRQELYWLSLLALSDAGLREIYATVEEATSHFHYVPRLPITKLDDLSQDILILSGNSGIGPYNSQLPAKVIVEAHPATNPDLIKWAQGTTLPVSDNYMITPENREAYEICIGRGSFNRPSPMHIMNGYELKNECPYLRDAHFLAAYALASECNAELRPATNIRSDETRSLLELCLDGADRRQLNLMASSEHSLRLKYELNLIEQKGFVDYFKVIADMVQYAKANMLVGPARGSSCGSLVCYLLGITDIDPIPHGLIFERFIDITREDLPDIDIDFPEDKRELVFDYLIAKYGHDKVARLGTVSRFKAKSAIGETAKAIRLNRYEADQIADVIIKRNDGDDRADYCIFDSLTDTDIGTELLKRHPNIMVASKLEAHAKFPGTHAAGVILTNDPINHYVARDVRNNTVHIDKYDAEKINLMKVDALGLGTLTIIADCLEQIGWTKEQLLAHPLDDDVAFKVLRQGFFCGVFQFAGNAVQDLARKVSIDRFSDMVALIALPRPGPLVSGAAHEWCARRMEQKPIELLHPMMESMTIETYGLIVYQEQMLRIVREIGGLSWEDTTALRKGMSKSLGLEYFERYWERFQDGAKYNGIDNILARQIWETVNSAGGYCFNKSHAVAYAMVAYWCCVLKGHYPLQFALATLRNIEDPLHIKQYLRELDRVGYTFKSFDGDKSDINWSVKDNVLLGGLTNVKGIGKKTALDIVARRRTGEPMTDNQIRLLEKGETQFDDVFEVRTKFAALLAEPERYGIVSKLWQIADIGSDEGNYAFIAKIVSFKIRSLNELQFLIKRDHMRVPNDKWLTLILEDDSGVIPATVSRRNYPKLGQPLTKDYKVGDYFVFRGTMQEGNRRIYIDKWKHLIPEKEETMRSPNQTTEQTPNGLVLQFTAEEFSQLKINTPGASGDMGGYQKFENLLIERTDRNRCCALTPVELERLIRYINNYGGGGPNERIRRACKPALARLGIILKG
jgi:DNA polymerase III alpha subunit